MKHLFYYIGRFFGLFTNEIFSLKIRAIKLYFRAGLIARRFRSFGKNNRIGTNIYFRGCQYITIGNNVEILDNAIITAWDKHNEQVFTPQISINDNSIISQACHISAVNRITIGKNAYIGKRVLIIDNIHGESHKTYTIPPAQRPVTSKGPVTIEDNVWIGDNACILPGVTIGANAVIGSGSIVTHDVQAGTIVVGNPAKPIN